MILQEKPTKLMMSKVRAYFVTSLMLAKVVMRKFIKIKKAGAWCSIYCKIKSNAAAILRNKIVQKFSQLKFWPIGFTIRGAFVLF